LFNNRIYGLTKGQYSPTSERGKITKSTPMGSPDHPFNPLSVALGAEATFVARTIDSDRKHLTEVLRAAAAHEGSAFVEVYQNCNIFNDGAWDPLKDGDVRDDITIRLVHGEPIRFGRDLERCVVRKADGSLTTALVADVDADSIVVHDAHAPDPTAAFALSRLSDPVTLKDTPIGVFRNVARPTYDSLVQAQLDEAVATRGRGDLTALLQGKDTWTIA
jgi:2-oxoglutarate/2-oxoacid ferredoxin oxidoreductase subunit beta